MKTEPEEFSIDTLESEGSTLWTGVRNYQARNHMMRDMKPGQTVFVYHSSCPQPGIYGLGQVESSPCVDPTQFDPRSPYFDPKSSAAKPRWHCAKIRFLEKWSRPVALSQIRHTPSLKEMALLKRGQRLSIQLVAPQQAKTLLRLALAPDNRHA
jgi:predicted RNA-binding protein with PUA-like domain